MPPGSPSSIGVARDGVVQYLGIKYASLENKFADAQICEYAADDTFDGSTYGPSAVAPPNACQYEFGLIQKSLPLPSGDPRSRDVECLNLNITVPGGELDTTSSGLPVFVFIHGGGFMHGSNAWPQYDQARIVKLSYDLGMSVIGVGINYRLGPLGFLSSVEMRNHGWRANNGLRDQRVALLWIQKHISLFGGDPGRVTCMGESAGAVSTMLHHVASEPLFHQAVSMSGTPLMLRPLPDAVAESTYQTVISTLGLQDSTTADRMAALSSLSASELLAQLPLGLPFLPREDGETVKDVVTFQDLELHVAVRAPRCATLLIGSCDMDASVFGIMLASKQIGCTRRFVAILENVMPEHASEVLEAYHMTRDMADLDAWLCIMNFATDINFHAPVHAYASAWPSAVYQYRFREPNSWDGPWKGFSSHVLDIAYLFLNYTEYMSALQVQLAEQFAKDIISFVNGIAPFPRSEPGSIFVKEYLSGGAQVSSRAKDRDHQTRWQTLFSRIGLESMFAVWAKFMSS